MGLSNLVPWKSSSATSSPTARSNDLFHGLQSRINSLFDDLFNGRGSIFSPLSQLNEGFNFSPKVNVEETPEALIVSAELPGMEQRDLKLSIDNDMLTISGERKREAHKEEGGASYFESSYGSFQRVIPLGVEVDEDKIDASLKSGMLKVILPKSELSRRKSKTISVR